MGYAILGIMVAHIKVNTAFPEGILSKLVALFCYSVFTGGFVFFSGLGLYSSLNHSSNYKRYIIKRIKRLLIPYWIISTPYFLYTDLYVGDGNWTSFVTHFTTVAFWLYGNYSGMWYISLTVFLYFLYPFIHSFFYKNAKIIVVNVSALSLLTVVCLFCVKNITPEYYEMTRVGISLAPMFLAGSITMYLVCNKTTTETLQLAIICIATFGTLIILDVDNIYLLINLISIFILSHVLGWLSNRSSRIIKILDWFGKYTLELYVLHLLLFNLFDQVDFTGERGTHMVLAVVISIMICVPIHRTFEWLTNKIG